ncbi:MAG: SDR family NAD(P)-dependent oxidoreductase [Candidatus Hydrogenedentota bacterium]
MSAAFAGLVKTARHEWSEVRCRVIDVGNAYASVDEAAKDVVKETLADGPIETGLDLGRRAALTLAPANALADAPPRFGADDVIVITGGARGVTAECAIALAEAYGCRLALFGRAQVPSQEDPSYVGIDDPSELKRRILAANSGAMAPKELETKYRELLAQREIRSTLDRIREAGGRPVYYSVDVRDAAAVRDTLARVRKDCGPITGLVHGAGVLADRLIEDKTLEQFDHVFDTKTAGLGNLLSALKDDSLKAIALFSSSTARFGRKGQCDYAAANEVLNKIAQAEARSRPGVRVVGLNWGPWDGGMVTPALRGLFASEGVSLIGLREGARLLVRELDAPASGPVEVVVLGAGSRVPNELTRADSADHSTIQFALSAEAFPFLESHVIDGKAVLPVSFYIEWFAHAALHANPGLRFEGLDGLAVLKGVILQSEESRALEFRVGRVRHDGHRGSVSVELWSRRADSEPALHAKADVLLSDKLERGQPALGVLELPAYKSGRGIYGKGRLFHGRHFQGIRDVEGCGEHGIAGVAGSAPRPGEWIAHPLRRSWLTDPLVIDCAFQLMILWSYDQFGHGSLPVRVGRYRQFQRGFPKAPVRVVARIKDRREHKAMSDIEFLDAGAGTLLARIEDYECVIDGALDRAFANNHIAGTPA